jgi:hypothetical protein
MQEIEDRITAKETFLFYFFAFDFVLSTGDARRSEGKSGAWVRWIFCFFSSFAAN